MTLIAHVKPITIGTLSKRTGCNIETIRYYERIGLLPPPPRSPGGNRLYDSDHFKRLTFIRRSRELGFTLDEVRTMLTLVDGNAYTCAEVQALSTQHLSGVRHKIKDLRKLEKTLATIVAQCSGDAVPECPIIDALFAESIPKQDEPTS